MVQSILYTTDLGLYSPYVLQHALSLARSFGAQLHVVHAVEPLSLFAESVLQTYVEETRLRELREKGMQVVLESIRQRVLESFREEMQDAGQDMQLIASLQVVQGDPPQVILDEANRLGVELVVVGSHSHGTAWDAPLGRTALRLLQLAEVPVYLVPMLQHRGRGDF